MRLRLPLLLGALVGAVIAASPAQAAQAAGCSSTKPAAAGKPKPSYKKPATVLAKNTRYAIVMTTTCGPIRIVLDRKLGGPIPNSIAFLATKHFFEKLPSTYHYKLGDVAMAKTQNDPSGAAGSQFFVISGPEGMQLPPDYGLLGHAADSASLATIKRIAALATTACGSSDCPPSKKVWIVTAKLVALK
jgi:hypothetical protein